MSASTLGGLLQECLLAVRYALPPNSSRPVSRSAMTKGCGGEVCPSEAPRKPGELEGDAKTMVGILKSLDTVGLGFVLFLRVRPTTVTSRPLSALHW